MMADISGALLRQMIEQNHQQCEAGHHRLRHDHTEDINDVNRQIEKLEGAQVADRTVIAELRGQRERRKELSGVKIVLLSAAIGTLPRFVELIVKVWTRQP